MNKFDKAINTALAKKIEIAKKKVRNRHGRIKPPNTPGHRPVSDVSPALKGGMNQDIAGPPTPL